MSKEKKTKPTTENLPNWVKKSPELLPVYDWWVREGRSTVTLLLVGAICVAGWFLFRNWRTDRIVAANNALMNSFTTDELEAAAARFRGSATGPALKLRLGKSYLDAERWEEAEKTYSDYVASAAKDDPFTSLAMLGKAYALEGGKKFDEAQKEFSLLAADTNLPVNATAKLGVARCMALKGDKDGAIKMLEASDDVRSKNLIETIRRFDPNRKAVSLFDAANSAAVKVGQETKAVADKPAAADANAKPADAKPADVKPEAAKPAAEKPAADKK